MKGNASTVIKVIFFGLSVFITGYSHPLFATDSAVGSKPNIILVMPDDVGYGDYACLGNPVMRTPSVDAFKKESLLFTQFHVSPTCSPTRSALMSGRHEFKNGVTHTIHERERLSPETFTLAQMLKSVGYTTGIFGKWHLGDEAAYQPDKRGFDEFYIHGAGGIGQTYPGSCGDAPRNTNINPTLMHNGKFEKTTGYCTDLFFAQAIRWMDSKRSGDKPFFAYIPLNAAHGPHVVPEEYYKQYLGKAGVTPEMAKFFGMIENVDTNFGALLKKLDEWGLASNTLVIYIGTDNGGTDGVNLYNAGMRGSKGSAWEGGTRSPCFIRWPGVTRGGTECAALTAHLDIFPTLAEITGATLDVKVKKQVEGRSMVPLLKNPQASWDDRNLFTHVGRWNVGQPPEKLGKCSVRNSRYALVHENKEWALYDLQQDPGQNDDVSAQHPDIVKSLTASYDQWWKDVEPLLVNERAHETAPKVNPYKEQYWKQFGGGPDAKKLKRMDSQNKSGPEDAINRSENNKSRKSANPS